MLARSKAQALGVLLRDSGPVTEAGDHSVERAVTVRDGLVHRPAQPWTPTVHHLLHHLHERLDDVVPQPVSLHPEGRGDLEILTHLPGLAGADCWPAQASENGLISAARLLRTVHDASRDYNAPPGATWGAAPQSPAEIICHGDPGPWNMVWRDGEAVGLFDWDFAYPGPAIDDVAYALEYVTPFRSNEEAI